ncbi:hypothetical protein INR77_14310 [Erythrobacter sp. SCSIO 43205]|uniref:response regulator n=1 Tax=Erythrobacter sp. SCSIO 43205 TaxID=2779361 RepID=UPI001CA81AD6|nr:response regulator [Erythrobacter sp. SCSIO 43205]UAB77926.1 hypothetical protein INR77_14310 [Erythrobacter sp. SCSIO 43205]
MAEKKAKVAIVEDDFLLAHEWMKALKKRGYDASHHATIDTGIAHCTRDWPDVVVLDAFFEITDGQLSNRGGVTFCAELSWVAKSTDRQMPIVIGVSGARVSKYMPRHVFETISREIMPVRLTKPFSLNSLVEEIGKLIGHDTTIESGVQSHRAP